MDVDYNRLHKYIKSQSNCGGDAFISPTNKCSVFVRFGKKKKSIITQVLLLLDCSVMRISLFICLRLASFLIMFAIVYIIISGRRKNKKKTKTSDKIVYLCAEVAPLPKAKHNGQFGGCRV